MSDFDKSLEVYIYFLNLMMKKHRSGHATIKVEIDGGRTYLKLVTREYDSETGEPNYYGCSVYAFVEKETGNVYKPASWKAPTKNHVRGNIYNLKEALKWAGPYGIGYMPSSGAPAGFTPDEDDSRLVTKFGLNAVAAAKLRKEFGVTI